MRRCAPDISAREDHRQGEETGTIPIQRPAHDRAPSLCIFEQDLVETSLLGGTLSIAASIFIAFLLIAEFRSYMRFESESVMVVDRSPHGDMLRINFNISFPALSCEYATLDVSDALGSKKLNLTKTVRKAPIDAETLKKVGYGVEDFQRPEPKYDDFFPEDDDDVPFDDADFAKPLDEASWDAHMKHYDVVIVNFFAPWCHWCQQLAPTWESVTQAVHQKYPEEDGRIRYGFGCFDCAVAPLALHRTILVCCSRSWWMYCAWIMGRII